MTAPTLSPVLEQARRRRTFAIISHPDAGKTTLTEKLLLYGGAVQEAGAVKAKGNRKSSTSDWMDMEKRRGISVTSTVLRFEHEDIVFNLLDTPGHRDFSEDTLRVLAAADSAVMLLDAARGVEPQTLRLFEVARARGIPLLTFINKYDRPGMEPLEMIDHIEEVLGLKAAPVTWPVGIPGDFRGVIDRSSGTFHKFTRTVGGASMAPRSCSASRRRPPRARPTTARRRSSACSTRSAPTSTSRRSPTAGARRCSSARRSRTSASGLLLAALERLAPAPAPRPDEDGEPRPVDAPFSAIVFKVQANMDPRHRDRLAFVRICSGRFERGMRATNARSGKPFVMAHAHDVFGQDRTVLEEAFPGDVVGVVNALDLLVGDTLYAGEPVRFPPIPTLAPEHFMRVSNRDAGRHKQFHKGLEHLEQEGVVHVLRRDVTADPTPVLAGVGPLQFEVAVDRLRGEFGVEVSLDATPWNVARRTDEDGRGKVTRGARGEVLVRSDGPRWPSSPASSRSSASPGITPRSRSTSS
jgi:peptide chain release factor 3